MPQSEIDSKVKASQQTTQPSEEASKPEKKKKDKPGSYDHTDEHSAVYSANGVFADDTPIDRAWARLHDQGYFAGPAVSKVFNYNKDTEMQYFQYAYAVRDLRDSNVNQTVVFHFGAPVHQISESGL